MMACLIDAYMGHSASRSYATIWQTDTGHLLSIYASRTEQISGHLHRYVHLTTPLLSRSLHGLHWVEHPFAETTYSWIPVAGLQCDPTVSKVTGKAMVLGWEVWYRSFVVVCWLVMFNLMHSLKFPGNKIMSGCRSQVSVFTSQRGDISCVVEVSGNIFLQIWNAVYL